MLDTDKSCYVGEKMKKKKPAVNAFKMLLTKSALLATTTTQSMICAKGA